MVQYKIYPKHLKVIQFNKFSLQLQIVCIITNYIIGLILLAKTEIIQKDYI